MTRADRLVFAAAAVLTLTVVALAVHLGWPWWAGAIFALLQFATLGMVWKHLRTRSELMRPMPAPMPAPAPIAPPPPPPPPVYGTDPVRDVSLPSIDPDYRFLFSTTVYWRPCAGAHPSPNVHPETLAVSAILGRAGALTSSRHPADHDLVRQALTAALAMAVPDQTGQVEAWAVEVAVSMSSGDLDRLRAAAELRRSEQLWADTVRREREKRAYLRDDVLATPGSAITWWLAHDETRIEETVKLIGTLAQLSAAANDREVDEVFRPLVEGPELAVTVTDGQGEFTVVRPDFGTDPIAHVRRVADDVFPHGDEPERARFADQLARLVSAYGADRLAAMIRAEFNAPDLTGAAAPEPRAPEPEPRPAPHPVPVPGPAEQFSGRLDGSPDGEWTLPIDNNS